MPVCLYANMPICLYQTTCIKPPSLSVPILQLKLALLTDPVAYLLCLHEVLFRLLEGNKRLLLQDAAEHLGVLVLNLLDLPPPYSYVQGLPPIEILS